MSKTVLKIISDAFDRLALPYAFGTFDLKPIPYPYFVGEYTEEEPFTEDGLQETAFIINGFSRGSWAALEDAREAIEQYFNRVSGYTVIAENNSAVAVFYANSFIVPTGDDELKRVQINLKIKEWKV